MRIEQLTFLRFVAAIVVVAYHFAGDTLLSRFAKPLLSAGPEMVTLFFVLSGFVMVLAYASTEQVDARNYWLARFARIYPVYLLALLLSLPFVEIAHNRLSLALNALLLQSWLPRFPLTVNPPGWSLSVEAFFYILFPLMLPRLSRLRTRSLASVAILLWAVTQLVVFAYLNSDFTDPTRSISSTLVVFFPPSHLCSFVLGVLGGHVFLRHIAHKRISSVAANCISALAIVCILALLYQQDSLRCALGVRHLTYRVGLLSPLFLALILGVAADTGRIATTISKRPFVTLGNASYAVYIMQCPVYWAYWSWLQPHLVLDANFHFLAYLAILISLSVAVFSYYEKPFQLFLRHQLRT